MFFKNIETWSKKKFKVVKWICEIIYFLLMVVIPTIIVCCQYDVFQTVEAKKKLTGVGIIMVIVLGIYAYVKLKQAVKKLPEIEYKEQLLKFTVEMVFEALPFILLIVGIIIVRDNLTLAFNTMLKCMISFLCATIWDGMFIKYLEAETDLRQEAKKRKAVDKRMDVV